MWPTNPHATPSLDDFKNAIREYVRHVGRESAYCMLYHISNKIEMVEKNYGGRTFDVPSVGIVFRWVEDASYSEQVRSQPRLVSLELLGSLTNGCIEISQVYPQIQAQD